MKILHVLFGLGFLLLGMTCRGQELAKDTTVHPSQIPLAELEAKIVKIESQLHQILVNDQTIGATANNIIAWSGFVLTALVFLIGAGAWFAGNRFRDIEKIKKELEIQLSESKEQISKEIQVISEIKAALTQSKLRFEEERNQALKVIFPLMEGQWYYYQGNANLAIKAYEKAYEINPNEGQIYSRLSKLLMEKGNIHEAISLLKEVVQKFPDDLWLYSRLGQAYRRAGEFEKSEQAYRKALAIDGTMWHALYGLGRLAMVQRQFSEAEEFMQEGIDIHRMQEGTFPSWMGLNLALVQHCLGKVEDRDKNGKRSYEIHKEQLKRTPKNPKIHANMGIYHLMRKEWREALKFFKTAEEVGFPLDFSRTYAVRVDLAVGNLSNKSIKEIRQILERRKELEDSSLPLYFGRD
ncbi:MAG: tetratricopeptide repeat protein [Bacteroidota bacterium]